MSFFMCHLSVDFLRLIAEGGARQASLSSLARVTGARHAESAAHRLVQRGLVVVIEGPSGTEVRLTEGGRRLARDLAARGWPTTGVARGPLADLYKKLRIRI